MGLARRLFGKLLGPRRNRRRTSPKEKLAASGRTVGRVGRFVAVVAIIGATAGGLPLAGYYGYRLVLDSGYFAPTRVHVEGMARLDRAAIIEAAGLSAPDVNLVEFDETEAKAAIERLPWVASAEVDVRLPDTVTIHVEEHTLLGVARGDRFYLIDEDGGIIKPWTPDDTLEGAIVSGVDPTRTDPVSQKILLTGFRIAHTYDAMGLGRWAGLAEVHFDPQLGFTLFAGDTEVRLGHDRFDDRMRRLWQVFVVLEERGTRPEYVLLDMEGDLDRVAIKAWPMVVAAPELPQAEPDTEE